MNRRSFLGSMLKAGVAAAFLPGAGRLWKRTEAGLLVNPDWTNAPYEVSFITCAEYAHILIRTNPWAMRFETDPATGLLVRTQPALDS